MPNQATTNTWFRAFISCIGKYLISTKKSIFHKNSFQHTRKADEYQLILNL